ncbi:hypothetical protein GIB67_028813 [Kingdonia uniflora]|uniref:asparagine--tRNA ligase n=1 Tax=Kingdonia uniflora TaxID=39325 RepID=A0A7J7LTC9_9MAGN|nr:hypothetical protein GIB67_028813 [Kingdonia uniflora]
MSTSEEGVQTVVALPTLPQSKYSKRVLLKSILTRSDQGLGLVGESVVIGGWVKTSKELAKDPPTTTTSTSMTTIDSPPTKDVTCVEIFQSRIPLFRSIFKVLNGSHSPRRRRFDSIVPVKPVPYVVYLQVNDGSCVPCLQVVLDSSVAPIGQFSPTGTSILVEGVLRQPSTSGKHSIELEVKKIVHVGTVGTAKYPFAKTRLTLDTLRSYSHLRPRTITVASITRIRSSLAQATHMFFQSHGIIYIHTPIITCVDSEGSSEKFQVTTILGKEVGKDESNSVDDTGAANLEAIKSAYKEKSNKIEELKRSESNKEALIIALQDLQKVNELALQMEAREKSKPRNSSKDGKSDFFHRQMYLTVSAQFHLESYACAVGSVYTFGPTFHAEKSQSTKHLAESWMVEVEIAFADIEDIIECAEDYAKFLCHWVSENCLEDMKFVSKRIGKNTVDQLQLVASSSFEKITYKEAVDLLNKITDKTFEAKVEWGSALTDEHERYLADEILKRTIIIYNYPKEVKPFFVRVNDDGKTVAAFDVVVPKVGKIIRGGQREERAEMLSARIKEFSLPREDYQWYLDLRRHGTVKHSGFSLGFDQLVLFATGLDDIRDIIPFPRTVGNANL